MNGVVTFGRDLRIGWRSLRRHAGFFDVFGARPALGRTFDESEHVRGRSDVVMLGYLAAENLILAGLGAAALRHRPPCP